MIYVHTWCPVDGEILEFPVTLNPNATQWLILELRQHKTKSNLIRVAETSEKNLFCSKRTVTADSPIWFVAPVWLMCRWRHTQKNKCKVADNYYDCWKQNYSLLITHGFLHCFWMTGLKAWLISFLFFLHFAQLQPNRPKESRVQQRVLICNPWDCAVTQTKTKTWDWVKFLRRCDYLKTHC